MAYQNQCTAKEGLKHFDVTPDFTERIEVLWNTGSRREANHVWWSAEGITLTYDDRSGVETAIIL